MKFLINFASYFIVLNSTILTLKAFYTLALEAVLAEVDARAIVIARFCRTVIYNQRAIRVSVTLAAFAFVTSDTINANFVIWACHANAIIDIHVAHLESYCVKFNYIYISVQVCTYINRVILSMFIYFIFFKRILNFLYDIYTISTM